MILELGLMVVAYYVGKGVKASEQEQKRRQDERNQGSKHRSRY